MTQIRPARGPRRPFRIFFSFLGHPLEFYKSSSLWGVHGIIYAVCLYGMYEGGRGHGWWFAISGSDFRFGDLFRSQCGGVAASASAHWGDYCGECVFGVDVRWLGGLFGVGVYEPGEGEGVMRRGGLYPWVGSRLGRRGFVGLSLGSGAAGGLLAIAGFVVLLILALPIPTRSDPSGHGPVTMVAMLAVGLIVVYALLRILGWGRGPGSEP